MHFEILVEDQSGKKALDILIPKLIGIENSFKVHPYKGIGRIPKNLCGKVDISKRILLMQLPKLLRGYGNTFANYPKDFPAVVILICDLDAKCLKVFREELFTILNACVQKPETRFCVAIEEGEAWFLGDIPALKKAYPKAKDAVLNAYVNDSICGTWEKLADAIYPGGSAALSNKGWQAIGSEKSEWAGKIAPHMDVNNNASPSFGYLRVKIMELTGSPPI
ncbi:MAG: DUF4276 family protein [Proteobacteria bacterium]|nr:DUF4276 family protein [Pseudomonadota bacterium]MBU1387387.1 DUF4276 family protein [Pseudomonadota bacterium]MBU1541672.1 DUF4276 family protein [Pseudomonadota bacterium]MBU2430034.1 DUF4276 family protein [Pseudomonadota bacterium]MBU2482061.1 DUF4276 family protein [Pseudomonadota bacterium]